MDKEHVLKICFGAMCPPLTKQLKGYGLTANQLKFFERVSNSITLLHLNSYIPESATDLARKNLAREIGKRIAELSKEEPK